MGVRDFDGEEWVSADAMDRQVRLREAAEQQRDRLLEGILEHRSTFDPVDVADQRLYKLAEEVEKEKEHGH